MATEWRMVRIPVELAEQLERLSAETNRAHAAGRLKLPTRVRSGSAAPCHDQDGRRLPRGPQTPWKASPERRHGHTDGDVRLDLTVYTPSTNK